MGTMICKHMLYNANMQISIDAIHDEVALCLNIRIVSDMPIVPFKGF